MDLEVPVEVSVKAVHEDIHLLLGDLPQRFLHRVPQSLGILGVDGVGNIQGVGQAGHGEDEFHGRDSSVQLTASPHGCHPAEVVGADGQAAEAAVKSLLEPAPNQGSVALGPVAQEQGQAGEILWNVLGKVISKHGAETARPHQFVLRVPGGSLRPRRDLAWGEEASFNCLVEVVFFP